MASNAVHDWDLFDSEAYFQHNYATLRNDDAQIIETAREFLVGSSLPNDLAGLDVGAGTNLYPALLLLPWCCSIDLWEFSKPNTEWLSAECQSFRASWDPFWMLLEHATPYRAVEDPRQRLSAISTVTAGSIFDLPERNWDIGTMFFVAESMSSDMGEFDLGLKRFIGALRSGSPFVAAFMEGSEGYDVGSERFPAVSIDSANVKEALHGLCVNVEISKLEVGLDALRPGYSGMLVATGYVT